MRGTNVITPLITPCRFTPGWAEIAFAPMFKRLWFLEYYEDYAPPSHLLRVLRWRDACVSHPVVQRHHGHRELMTLYYDYS